MANLAVIDPNELGATFIGKVPTNDEEAMTLLNAMNNPSQSVSQYINTVLNITNVYIEVVTIANRNQNKEDPTSPATITMPRTVLIDTEGTSYACAARGIYQSLEKLFALYGTPTNWSAPMSIKIKQVPTNNGSMLTFDLVGANGNKLLMG